MFMSHVKSDDLVPDALVARLWDQRLVVSVDVRQRRDGRLRETLTVAALTAGV